ncbi:MAG: efflux RND transporter permease subunit, partial [Rhodospirillaceae bacterium]|nr:efflux RND transporter permease subunit [Rhodospirillaceae bacterium]
MLGPLYFRQPRLVVLTLGAVLVAGLASLTEIGRQEDPSITNRFATILTPFPGASADRVEALVTVPIEDELRAIAEVDTVTSTSRTDLSAITVELNETVADPSPVFSEIRDALDDAALTFPAGVGEPEFDDTRGPPAYTMLVGLTWQADGPANRAILDRLSEELENRLRAVPNTELVNRFGAPDEEILAVVDPDVLASLGLTLDQVAAAIDGADAKVSAGQIHGSASDLLIEVSGELDTLDRIRAVPLGEQPDGTLVRLGDIATLSRGVADPPSQLALVGGRDAVVVAARMAADHRVDRWAERARQVVADFRAEAPLGVGVEVMFDQSVYTDERLGTLLGNLGTGAALVLVVLFVTLGWRSALVVGTALPVTSLIALATLNFLGIPIHQISVTGLIVALGLLVDNAIVMTDAIRHRLAHGMARLEAVADAGRLLWLPLLASTLTTVLAFMPIALLPGATGEFVGPLALSVIVALVSSYAVAMTVVPALAGRFVGSGEGSGFAGFVRHGLSIRPLTRAFAWSLDLSLAHPRLSILAASVPAVLGFIGMGTLPEQFFPPADRDQFHIQVFLSDDASIAQTRRVVERMQQVIAGEPGVASVDWFLGTSAPPPYYNLVMNQDGAANFAEALVTAASPADAVRLIPLLQARLDAEVPQAQTIVRELLQGAPVDAPVELRLYGPNLEVLRDIGDRLRRVMTEVPLITHVQTDLGGGTPQVRIAADEDAVRLAGLSLVDVAGQLDANLGGRIGGSVLEGTEEIPVRVRAGGADRSTLAGLAALPLALSGGTSNGAVGIPLTAVAELTLAPQRALIARRNGERVNAVVGFVGQGTLPAVALADVRALLDRHPVDLPPGYRLEVGGDAAERDEAVGNLASS